MKCHGCQVVEALRSAGVMVLGGPRAIELGVVDQASPGFKTEYGEEGSRIRDSLKSPLVVGGAHMPHLALKNGHTDGYEVWSALSWTQEAPLQKSGFLHHSHIHKSMFIFPELCLLELVVHCTQLPFRLLPLVLESVSWKVGT